MMFIVILKKQAGLFFHFFVTSLHFTSLNPIILLIFKLCFNKLFQLPQIVLLEHSLCKLWRAIQFLGQKRNFNKKPKKNTTNNFQAK